MVWELVRAYACSDALCCENITTDKENKREKQSE